MYSWWIFFLFQRLRNSVIADNLGRESIEMENIWNAQRTE